MAERRDRSADIQMRDGTMRKGRVIGHSDASGRIREADTPLRRGEELGSIDEKHRIRRKGGLLRRGEIVGRIRGNAVYTSEGLLTGGLKVGHVDESGNVWQTDCRAFRGRIVGRARGADPDSALAYFLLKFQEIEDAVATLEEKVRVSEDKYAFLPRVRSMQKLLPEVDALGDFDAIVRRLETLEEVCAADLGHHFTGEKARIVESATKKITPESTLEALRREWDVGVTLPLEQAEALVGRVRGALGALSEGRRRNRGDSVPPEGGQLVPPTLPPPSPVPELRDEGDEAASRAELLLEAALGPVDRLREEIDRIRKDPDYGAEEMIERLRGAMTSVLEARDLTSLTGAFPKLGAALGGHAEAKSVPPRVPEPTLAVRSKDSNARPISVPPPPAPPPTPSMPEPRPAPASASTALARYEPQVTDTRAFVEALLETREASAIFDVIDRSLDRLRELDATRKEGIATVREALERLRQGS